MARTELHGILRAPEQMASLGLDSELMWTADHILPAFRGMVMGLTRNSEVRGQGTRSSLKFRDHPSPAPTCELLCGRTQK